MIINILAAGPEQYIPKLDSYHSDEGQWIGVDKGTVTLLSKGIQPIMAFGDFDSVSEDEMKQIESGVSKLNRFKPEKDETDMELALNWALEQNPQLIRVFGGTGGRLDHFFANVQLLVQPLLREVPVPIEMIDEKNIIYIKNPGEYHIHKRDSFNYISFIPMTMAVENLTLIGFKYPLSDKHIPFGSTLCISNELLDDNGTFSFTEGILMVVRSKD
ncbi:thiamine pyrophosphokinase [Cytobacillus horneckiae]|uniref:Thiamine diphosphokinase n=1 Tax=Cytobacillus horneckiae TaxID=549687 RepID=A0A2N0ZM64_9BACI|nr:thiamine diphosphokinase [Cytobacillus horneckiae]NRG45639.1 thiamine diphosphokinase [Bacillus sp. CRN 9]MBN6887114.1 thiamine diphosphokinase [Cytobacillus horneckiae]MCM3178295.1 thiamine diphosphokinase [Cytobacillus horneckiae]MEC1156965.1 thiamine diphosphokinase [Cytobacillus horneckiae]MED2940009.1 thiamine diphosphokinase [Cytobacillus horneckiae]